MNTLTSQRSYINGYGFRNCKMKGPMKTWMNKHNESHSDGVHYHHFVMTKALNSKSDDMVKMRLYHFGDFDDAYHTIEYLSSKDYCLDTAYRYRDKEKGNVLLGGLKFFLRHNIMAIFIQFSFSHTYLTITTFRERHIILRNRCQNLSQSSCLYAI